MFRKLALYTAVTTTVLLSFAVHTAESKPRVFTVTELADPSKLLLSIVGHVFG